MAQLDGDHSRGKLLFKCGTILNFETGSKRKAVPEDRLGHCMGCAALDFQPDCPTEPVFNEITQWVNSGDTELKESNLGSRIVDHLAELRRIRPALANGTAVDCGAGIGRVAKHFLLPNFGEVHLLEQSPPLLAATPTPHSRRRPPPRCRGARPEPKATGCRPKRVLCFHHGG